MVDTHRGVPLAAYNSNQELIPPASYRACLQGAFIEIHFRMSHCAFKRKDTYAADIDTIRVLRAPPPPLNVIGAKRKLPSKFESPTTRRRLL